VGSTNPLDARRIALGVTGSIAAYKAVAVASALVQQGALVDVVMTPEAAQLVQPLSFQAITHRAVSLDMFHLLAETEIGHVSIGRAAEAYVIAPATAHTIAKLALGLADDMVTTTALATTAPVVLAPAMETAMWRNAATQSHVASLRQRGWTIVEPGIGHLASGASGEGRLADPAWIVDVTKHVLAASGDLSGRRVVVTAGGTREPIDPVRFIGNRSSGKMGFALSEAARDRGASVTLITTVEPEPRAGVTVLRVERAAEMRDAVLALLPNVDTLIMAAAVADYAPAEAAAQKIKKGGQELSIQLALTPDVLADVAAVKAGAARPVVVGFAAETQDVLANAKQKLVRKGLDLLVANDVSRSDIGFGSDFNLVTLLYPDGRHVELPKLPKVDVAHAIWDAVIPLMGPP